MLPEPDPGILKRVARALLEGMIQPGDRILLGLSGGKDSLTLAAHLARLSQRFQVPFTVEALHVEADFAGCGSKPGFLDMVRGWGLQVQTLPVAIQGRLKPGRKLNCYWCSTQRRKELLDYARSRGFTKVALGHHLDDILETLFMNMAYKAEVGTMLPVMVYDRHDAVVIRPLTYVTNEQTLAYARSRGFLSEAAVCPFGTTSLRLKAREAVRVLASGGPGVRENLLKSLSAVRDRYLPGWHGQSDPPTRLPPDGDLLER